MGRQLGNFRAPPALPIAIGAVAPDPAYQGATAYSTTALLMLWWNGGSWQPLGDGGRGWALIDFGAAGSTDCSTVITGQTLITAASVVQVDLVVQASVDHSADEHLVEEIVLRAGKIVPGVGFTIYARTRNEMLYGKWNVTWTWS